MEGGWHVEMTGHRCILDGLMGCVLDALTELGHRVPDSS